MMRLATYVAISYILSLIGIAVVNLVFGTPYSIRNATLFISGFATALAIVDGRRRLRRRVRRGYPIANIPRSGKGNIKPPNTRRKPLTNPPEQGKRNV